MSRASATPREGSPRPRELLLEAARTAVSERGDAYGNPAPFFAAVAKRWSLTLGVDVSARQVVLCLLDLKQQRAVAGSGDDTFADIAGYAACAYEIDEMLGRCAGGACR